MALLNMVRIAALLLVSLSLALSGATAGTTTFRFNKATAPSRAPRPGGPTKRTAGAPLPAPRRPGGPTKRPAGAPLPALRRPGGPIAAPAAKNKSKVPSPATDAAKYKEVEAFLTEIVKKAEVTMNKVVDKLLKDQITDEAANRRIQLCSQAQANSLGALNKGLTDLRAYNFDQAVSDVIDFFTEVEVCAQSLGDKELEQWTALVIQDFVEKAEFGESTDRVSSSPRPSPAVPRKKSFSLSPKPAPTVPKKKKSFSLSPKPAPTVPKKKSPSPSPKPAPTVPHKKSPKPAAPTVPKKISPSPKPAPKTPRKISPSPKPAPKKITPFSPKPAPKKITHLSPKPAPKKITPHPIPRKIVPKKITTLSPKPAPSKKSNPAVPAHQNFSPEDHHYDYSELEALLHEIEEQRWTMLEKAIRELEENEETVDICTQAEQDSEQALRNAEAHLLDGNFHDLLSDLADFDSAIHQCSESSGDSELGIWADDQYQSFEKLIIV